MTDVGAWTPYLINSNQDSPVHNSFSIQSEEGKIYHGSSGEKIKIVHEGFCWLF